MAPRDESSLLMQRQEDSNLRRFWRLTRLYLMIRGQSGEPDGDEEGA